jgi:hypothetical protein
MNKHPLHTCLHTWFNWWNLLCGWKLYHVLTVCVNLAFKPWKRKYNFLRTHLGTHILLFLSPVPLPPHLPNRFPNILDILLIQFPSPINRSSPWQYNSHIYNIQSPTHSTRANFMVQHLFLENMIFLFFNSSSYKNIGWLKAVSLFVHFK